MPETELPLTEPGSLSGIISRLTEQYSGNVHVKGVVTITSQSLYSDNDTYSVKNLADLGARGEFWSKDEPGQWICWDFGRFRIRPAHYTLTADKLKSWVVESSLDKQTWREIDRQIDCQDFRNKPEKASFPTLDQSEARYIRLTQTAPNYLGVNWLLVYDFELFGTLVEGKGGHTRRKRQAASLPRGPDSILVPKW
jgi:hypothetical protein